MVCYYDVKKEGRYICPSMLIGVSLVAQTVKNLPAIQET